MLGWEDESDSLRGKTSAQITLKKSKDEIKKFRAQIVQDKSKILNPLEEKIKVIEKNIFDLERELNLNTEQLIIASTEGNVSVISEISKLNKILKNKNRIFICET